MGTYIPTIKGDKGQINHLSTTIKTHNMNKIVRCEDCEPF